MIRCLVLCHRINSPPDLLHRDGTCQNRIFLGRDPINRGRNSIKLTSTQMSSPPLREEVEKLLSNSLLIFNPVPHLITQYPDPVPLSPHDGWLVKESYILIPLSNPLDSRLLPLKDLLLTQQRVVKGQLATKLSQTLLKKKMQPPKLKNSRPKEQRDTRLETGLVPQKLTGGCWWISL